MTAVAKHPARFLPDRDLYGAALDVAPHGGPGTHASLTVKEKGRLDGQVFILTRDIARALAAYLSEWAAA